MQRRRAVALRQLHLRSRHEHQPGALVLVIGAGGIERGEAAMVAHVTHRAATQEDLDAVGTAKLARDVERGRAVVLAAVDVSLGIHEYGDALGVPQPAGRV